jgi:hypothetical protein
MEVKIVCYLVPIILIKTDFFSFNDILNCHGALETDQMIVLLLILREDFKAF